MTSTTTDQANSPSPSIRELRSATVRLAGDSGDGMQLTGSQLTNTSALAGNDVATFPDYPAEIRAPKGTRAGISGFQVQFAAEDIFTPGDRVDALYSQLCAMSAMRRTIRLSFTKGASMAFIAPISALSFRNGRRSAQSSRITKQ